MTLHLPVIDIPTGYEESRMTVRGRPDGSSMLLILHKTLPTLWYCEDRHGWQQLVGHVTELDK